MGAPYFIKCVHFVKEGEVLIEAGMKVHERERANKSQFHVGIAASHKGDVGHKGEAY
jgi:hypothetical protein